MFIPILYFSLKKVEGRKKRVKALQDKAFRFLPFFYLLDKCRNNMKVDKYLFICYNRIMDNNEMNSLLKTATHVFKEYGRKDPDRNEVSLGSLSFNKVQKNDTTFYNISKDGDYVVSFIERDDKFKCKVHDENNLAIVKDSIYRVEKLHYMNELQEIKQRREAENWVLGR